MTTEDRTSTSVLTGLDMRRRFQRSGDNDRPLEIALLNLMPNKAVTARQFQKLFDGAASNVRLTLIRPGSYQPKNSDPIYLARHYRTWRAVEHRRFDGLIVTGAPVEHLDFEEVAYWEELQQIFDWAREKETQVFAICWAGQAALYHFHGVPKNGLPAKAFGVYTQRCWRPHRLLEGLEAGFPTPVSRHTEVTLANLAKHSALSVLAASPESGVCLVEDQKSRVIAMFNHLEYERETLGEEFRRDLKAGYGINLPANYFPSDDSAACPPWSWRYAGRKLFGNWLRGLRPQKAMLSEAA
jgi:homoserine O-succinyltransferase